MADAKTVKRTATSADRPTESSTRKVTITNDDIAARAYARYLARGGEPGYDVDDWLQAERELESDPEC